MRTVFLGLSILLVAVLLGLAAFYYRLQLTSPTPLTTVDNIPFFRSSPDTPEADQDTTVEIVFTGDIMLDRNIRLKAQQHGYDFLIGPRLRELLTAADYTAVNLEGPVTNNDSVSVGSAVGSTRNFIFTFAPETTEFLNKHNMTIVNLGNNHILNFGADGLAQTYEYLDQGNIKYFGYTSLDQPENSRTYTLPVGDHTIGFVNYNQFVTGGEDQAFEDITNLTPSVDYLIMYTHWGNEYVPENQVLIDLAHRFIDSGVDLVIGSHPHVVTGKEEYKGKQIYYSLGNFIFDQYFDDEVRRGLVVKAMINPETKETSTQDFEVSISPSGQTELLDSSAFNAE